MKRILVIDSDDKGHFFLSAAGGTLTIGDSPAHAEAVLRDLHILRISCEVEVSEDVVVVGTPADAKHPAADKGGLRKELRPGEKLRIGHAQLRLEAAGEVESAANDLDAELAALASPMPAPAPAGGTDAGATAAGHGLLKQLRVIDGADQKRYFRLPEAGVVGIGRSAKHADIVLHDFFVSRVHCELKIDGDRVMVTHQEGDHGTLINGQRIKGEQELRLGEVLRVGNSQMRLEVAPAEGPASEPEESDVEEVELEVLEEEAGEKAGDAPAAAEPPKPGKGAKTPVPSPMDGLSSLEGTTLGHYRLGRLLGRGHSGRVFRAEDIKTGQVVALKVLPPEFPATGAELQQFVLALRGATPLHHANLVSLFGAGKNGLTCWIAREFIDGDSVDCLARRLLDEGKLSWNRAARVAVHLGRALRFLHGHKVVHGNITPQNVLISSADKATKLADLMLMNALGGSQLQKLILEKKLLSELAYMAPEQVEPDAFVDNLADLYALGAVAYLLATGQPPFAGNTPEELITRIQDAPVVRPTKYQPKMPAPFETILLKLLAKHQEDRYQTAAELLADVEPLARQHEIKL